MGVFRRSRTTVSLFHRRFQGVVRMLEKTYIYPNGDNRFSNHVFDASHWSAPAYVSPDKMRTALHSFGLEGRTIRHLRLIGLSYMHRRDFIEDACYNRLEQSGQKLSEEELQRLSAFENIGDDFDFLRYAEIDEPLMIEFEDGDVFQICTPQEPEFRFSMNCIPWDIRAGTNLPNMNADILFSPCVGKQISKVEVRTYVTDRDPMGSDFFDDAQSKRELVRCVILRFPDGTGLAIEGFIDFCHVQLINPDDGIEFIKFADLKSALFDLD